MIVIECFSEGREELRLKRNICLKAKRSGNDESGSATGLPPFLAGCLAFVDSKIKSELDSSILIRQENVIQLSLAWLAIFSAQVVGGMVKVG